MRTPSVSILAALAGIAALIAVVACGDEFRSTIEIVVEADTSMLPPNADVDAEVNEVAEVIERRIDAAGASGRVTVTEPNRLLVEIGGIDISEDEAAELFGKTALLEFRKPARDDSGQIVCIAPDGGEFSVPLANAGEGFNTGTGEREGQCTSGGTGTPVVGLINWEPATGLDSSGTSRVLTGSFVEPGGSDVIAGGSAQCLPACVTLVFTSEGGLLLQQITEDIVGYPLAIFLDEELVSAPPVAQTITGGNAVISGLGVDEARTLSIQINAGSPPVRLRTIEVRVIGAESSD